jgi:hypothetical protein
MKTESATVQAATDLADLATSGRLNNRLGVLEMIRCGELAVQKGNVTSHAKAKERMARWLK